MFHFATTLTPHKVGAGLGNWTGSSEPPVLETSKLLGVIDGAEVTMLSTDNTPECQLYVAAADTIATVTLYQGGFGGTTYGPYAVAAAKFQVTDTLPDDAYVAKGDDGAAGEVMIDGAITIDGCYGLEYDLEYG